MRLPYLFGYEDGVYLSGPMLQGTQWFNLYLNPLGFTFSECRLGRDEVCAALRSSSPAMLGIRVSPERKHAVVYTGQRNREYRFLNNKRKDSSEPETLHLTETDLLARLDEIAVVGILRHADKIQVDYRPYLESSVSVLRDLQDKIHRFSMEEQSPISLRKAVNRLFRPILLDGITMLELLDETGLAAQLRTVQKQFLSIVREDCPVVLSEKLDMIIFDNAVKQYERLIMEQMER